MSAVHSSLHLPPGSAVEIQPATWRDLNALRKLEAVCFPLDAWPMLDLFGVLTFPGLLRYKAILDGQMAGFIAAERKPGEQAGWIATVAVLPEYRRRGIAQSLIAQCEANLGAPEMRLCVRVSNQGAIELYKKLDYEVLSTWRQYYRDGEDALVMRKFLPGAGE